MGHSITNASITEGNMCNQGDTAVTSPNAAVSEHPVMSMKSATQRFEPKKQNV